MASTATEPTKNSGKGRRKIEMKKVEQSSKRLVTFSKRKLGLFRKAAELSLLCGSDIAVVVFSQHGKVFSSGYPNPDSVIRRYLSGTLFSSSSSDLASVAHDWEEEPAVSSLRREYEEAMKVLDDEKKSLNAMADIPGSWWNRSVAEMGLEEVVEFKERVEQLRKNLVAAAENKKEKKTTSLVSSSPALMMTATTTMPEEGLSLSLLNDDDQAWNLWTSLNDEEVEEKKTASLVTSSTMTTASTVTSPPTTTEEDCLYYSSLLNDEGFEIDQTWDWDWNSWNESTSCNDSSMVWNSDLGLGQSYERLHH